MMLARVLALGLLIDNGMSVRLAGKVHPWPCKNGNFMRTGQGKLSGAGPRDISKAAWVFEREHNRSDDQMYQSPVIDSERNTFFSANTARMFSVSPQGKLNWAVDLAKEQRPKGQPPTPVLHGDALYTVDGQGHAVALALASGRELWRAKYAFSSGQDSWSMGLDETTSTLFALGFPSSEASMYCQYGGTHLYALDLHDGHTKWVHQMTACNCNLMASVVDGLVIFSDDSGRTYALEVATGKPVWTMPGTEGSFSTGTAAVGENGLVFVASNKGASKGLMRAYDLHTGKLRWERRFAREANNAPATYRDRNNRLLVAMGISNNAGIPMGGRASFNGTVFSLDAETGETVWTFNPPEWKQSACAGSSWTELCLPDAFTNPSVDASGTLYIGWMGGVAYAIDGTTGSMLSSWETRSGMQGAPAVADGMVVFSSCQRMAAFAQQQP